MNSEKLKLGFAAKSNRVSVLTSMSLILIRARNHKLARKGLVSEDVLFLEVRTLDVVVCYLDRNRTGKERNSPQNGRLEFHLFASDARI